MNLHRWTDASTCLPSLNPQRSNLNPHIVIVLEYSNPPTSCEHRPSAYTPGRRQWSSLTAAQRCHRRKIQSWRRRDAVGASLRGPVATLPCQVQVAQAVGRQREGTYPTIALQVCLDVEKAKSGNCGNSPAWKWQARGKREMSSSDKFSASSPLRTHHDMDDAGSDQIIQVR